MNLFNFKKKKINSKLPTKQAERLDYMTNNSAYNPDYERAGEITKTTKRKLYGTPGSDEKFAVEVDGNNNSIACLPLHSKNNDKRNLLSNKRRVLANVPGSQYVDKEIVTTDYKKKDLRKSDFKLTNKSLQKEELDKIKIICKNDKNKIASKKFKEKKKAK